jgi:hypothetical protein
MRSVAAVERFAYDMRKHDISHLTTCACPFYASYWPERSSTLVHLGGNECGLEVDARVPCYMEVERRTVNYYTCSRMYARQGLLNSFRHIIVFSRGNEHFTLAEWEQAHMRRLD